jgi:RHS repeat-associated protein
MTMRAKIFSAILLSFGFGTRFVCYSQAVETVVDIEISSVPSKSYLVNRVGRIMPGNYGVAIKGSTEFFLKANQLFHGAPSPEKNFIRIDNLYASESGFIKDPVKSRVYQYFNGLGTPVQTVNVGSSPLRNDVVNFKEVDSYARELRNYLPYVSGKNGKFHINPVDEQKIFYRGTPMVAFDSIPYTLNEYDNSPQNKIRKVFSPGWDWHNDSDSRPLKNSLKTNRAGEVFSISLSVAGLPIYQNQFHQPNVLAITEISDEAGQIKKSYKDFQNQVVLDRIGDSLLWHDTYYVYDLCGRLSFIFPPEAANRMNEYMSAVDQQAFLDTWCFQFKYDVFGRLVEKRIPGSGWIYFIYDRWDREVLIQDANMRENKQWKYTKYDVHNRPILYGLVTGERTSLQSEVSKSSVRFEDRDRTAIGYTNNVFPFHTEENLLSIYYYDCYNFTKYPSWDVEGFSFSPVAVPDVVDISNILYGLDKLKIYFPVVRGYLTGSKVKIMGSSKWLNSVNYYNKEYRIVQTISENHLGGLDITSKVYDQFTGIELKSKTSHSTTVHNVDIFQEFKYDHADRLVKVYHQINNGAKVLMVSRKYNELGQPIERNVHSLDETNFLQSIDSRYNIQGWLTHINNSGLTNDGISNDDLDDLFGMEIIYNRSASLSNGAFVSKKQFDGNVSAIKWKTNTKVAGATPQEKIYGFQYDKFKRFNQSYYATNISGAWRGNPALYNEAVLYYDRNGNIGGQGAEALSRYGQANGTRALVDNLSYRYIGNQLKNVRDNSAHKSGFTDKPGVDLSVNEYSYDANGNLIEDFNKSISKIVYNHLNLPVEITFTRVSPIRVDKILYTYDASGNKIRKEVRIGDNLYWTTDYVNGVQYDNNKPSFFPTSEGRAVYNGTEYEYEYFLKDYQGNVRLVCGLLKETLNYKATLETALDDQERNVYGFRNIVETRFAGNNFTSSSEKVLNPNKSSKCNSYGDDVTAPSPIGPAKSIKVARGDAIYTEVYARFNEVKKLSGTIAPVLLAPFVTSAFNVTQLENPTLWQGMNANASATAFVPAGSTVPDGYLVLLFFDDQFNFKDAAVKPISESAYKAFEKLTISFTPEIDGYVYIYVVNESNTSTLLDVYFDDLYIVHQKNNLTPQVLQASDYYPFGLSFNEFVSDRLRTVSTTSGHVYEPVLRNRFLFQGQELEKDLGLSWYQFKYRMHDPAIGRFGALDPLSEKYPHNSPYAFSENSLTNAVELEGLEKSIIFETMKFVSPVAFKVNFSFTTHETKIGFDISVGLPKACPFSYRKGFGASFNSFDIFQNKSLVETRKTTEHSFFSGLVSVQSTQYSSGKTSQTTGSVTLGTPLVSIQSENDWNPGFAKFLDPFNFHPRNLGDGSDRYRTAAFNIQLGVFNTGFKLATGDPGRDGKEHRDFLLGGKAGTYTPYKIGYQSYDPNQYRLGLAYFDFNGFNLGLNNEMIRQQIQNEWVHDSFDPPVPWFQVLPANDQLYFGYSNGSSTQW